MAVYRPTYRDPKTGKLTEARVWWYEFTFAGERHRESSKSTRKTLAIGAEKNRRLELERAYSGQGTVEPAAQRVRTVKSALAEYQKIYPVNHRAKSVDIVKQRSPHIERLLGNLLMPDLTEKRVMAYMADRKAEGAGNRTINLELAVLSRAVGSKFQILWPKVRRLEENHNVGRALERAEEEAILSVAAKRRSPNLIYPFLYLLAWSGMRSDEARTLRWSQVNFTTGDIVVERAKTEAGRRRIPMSASLRAVLEQHAAWYVNRLGPLQPDWYVFPGTKVKPINPLKPVVSLKKTWFDIREKAGVKCRLHDLRHSFCTKLAEAGVPESTMMDIMGHMSTAMLRHYSHIRAQARRDAIDAVESRQNAVGVPKELPKVAISGKAKATASN